MFSNIWFNIILVLIIFNFIFSSILEYINDKNWKNYVPDELKEFYPSEKYQKARDYKLETGRISFLSSSISFTLTMVLIIFGIYGTVSDIVTRSTESIFLQSVLFFSIFFLINYIINLPIKFYSIFVVEEKFGFNKTTKKLFLIDQIKSLVLSALIGGGLLFSAIQLFIVFKENFWIYLWLGLSIFLIFINTFYATLIVPIFNKLQPLSDGELRSKINEYSKTIGYSLKNIFIIDGSKRSTKANAFFSGLGPKKTIALYDTLIENHTEEELLAVLAHEVGHYKKNHVFKGLILSIAQIGLMCFLFQLCLNEGLISFALGAEIPTFHLGLIGFSLLYSPIGLITGLMMNIFSRKNEYEADKFAKDTYDGNHLSLALKKLSANNLSNLYPHPFYAFIHYSHPPLLKRLSALKN
ncbi:MAG: M48 family peptidase [Flavobacteriaceae bacterium TMED206]|nr:MAG: M48 family peptidase [Flavobacteriaceae bacterium TMED206]